MSKILSSVHTANDDAYKNEDTVSLVSRLEASFAEIRKNTRKPNVLLTGMTGAGKSSIINQVFGTSAVKTGTGTPITQHFERIELPNRPVVLYDAKGLEHGHHDEYISNMRSFFEKQIGMEQQDSIHVIWYVINSANSRIQVFEEILLREVFQNIPIIVILNKADISTPESRKALRDIINGLGLKNLLGVYDVTAHKSDLQSSATIEVCTRCQSQNISIKPKQKTWECEDCGAKGSTETMMNADGLPEVVAKTVQCIPEFTRDAFISAQFVNLSLKEKRSQEIIRDYYDRATRIRMTGTLMTELSTMLSKLSLIWDFRESQSGSKSFSQDAASAIVGAISVQERMSMLLTRKRTFALETTSMGVLWTRCLQKMTTLLLKEYVHSHKSATELELILDQVMVDAFQDLNDPNLDQIVQSLNGKGLDHVFDQEKTMLVNQYNQLVQK